MQRNRRDPDPPRQTLMVLRAVWVGDLALQALFVAGAWGVTSVHWYVGYPGAQPALVYATLGVLAAAVPLGYFARNQIYKAHWRGRAVTPRGYTLGNAALAGALEVATTCSVLAVLAVGHPLPLIFPACVSLVIYGLNFPHGKPMRQTPPRV